MRWLVSNNEIEMRWIIGKTVLRLECDLGQQVSIVTSHWPAGQTNHLSALSNHNTDNNTPPCQGHRVPN